MDFGSGLEAGRRRRVLPGLFAALGGEGERRINELRVVDCRFVDADGGGGVADQGVDAALGAGEGTEGRRLLQQPEGGLVPVVVVPPECVLNEAGFETIDIVAPLAVVNVGGEQGAEGGVGLKGAERSGLGQSIVVPGFGQGAGGAGEAPAAVRPG